MVAEHESGIHFLEHFSSSPKNCIFPVEKWLFFWQRNSIQPNGCQIRKNIFHSMFWAFFFKCIVILHLTMNLLIFFRGVYLSCLLYHEDKVLVTNEDFLPVIEVDETYPKKIHNDFHWFFKV